MINVFQPTLGEEELRAVSEVFASGWIGRGPRTEEFEARFAEHLGVEAPHVQMLTCCTEALFQAVDALGIGAGDEVVLPTVSFVGAGNAVAASGARPVFCDVDRRTLNPRPEHVEACLTPRTRAILPLHYGGYPGWISELAALARDRGLHLIEDAACAPASSRDGVACGTFGDIGAWSFDAMKILVAGDGGALYVRDPELAARMRTQAYLGLETASGFSAAASAGRWWEFEISSFSRRAITNDVEAAMGLVQLRRLADFIRRRREVHAAYDAAFAELGWLEGPPPLPPGCESSHYFYWVQTSPERRDRLSVHLRERGIYTTFRYWPLHRVSAYGSDAVLPEAEEATETTLCLPIHQGLTESDVEQVVTAVCDFAPDA